MRLRDVARLNGYFTARQDSVPQDEPELSMDDINKLVNPSQNRNRLQRPERK